LLDRRHHLGDRAADRVDPGHHPRPAGLRRGGRQEAGADAQPGAGPPAPGPPRPYGRVTRTAAAAAGGTGLPRPPRLLVFGRPRLLSGVGVYWAARLTGRRP